MPIQQNTPLLVRQLEALIDGEPNLIANLSNASALLFQHFENINWAGFYLYEKELLIGVSHFLFFVFKLTL